MLLFESMHAGRHGRVSSRYFLHGGSDKKIPPGFLQDQGIYTFCVLSFCVHVLYVGLSDRK